MIASLFDYSLYNWLWIVFVLSWLLVTIPWCITMQRALETIDPAFHKATPPTVWITLVPLVGLFWQFMVTFAVADGLREEFSRRSVITREPRPGLSAGLTASILSCCILAPSFGILIAIISHIPRLIHLGKISQYTKQLTHVIDVQAQMVHQPPLDLSQYSEPQPDENELMQKTNPDRFKPPVDPEEDLDRWRKK